jgi:hypothetical protein
MAPAPHEDQKDEALLAGTMASAEAVGAAPALPSSKELRKTRMLSDIVAELDQTQPPSDGSGSNASTQYETPTGTRPRPPAFDRVHRDDSDGRNPHAEYTHADDDRRAGVPGQVGTVPEDSVSGVGRAMAPPLRGRAGSLHKHLGLHINIPLPPPLPGVVEYSCVLIPFSAHL